jgi:hypothetical protein
MRDIITCKFTKIKAKSKIMSFIGLKKNNKIEKNYLIFLDEFYVYSLKDIEVDKNNKFIRKIGNKYNLKLLQNAAINVIIYIYIYIIILRI